MASAGTIVPSVWTSPKTSIHSQLPAVLVLSLKKLAHSTRSNSAVREQWQEHRVERTMSEGDAKSHLSFCTSLILINNFFLKTFVQEYFRKERAIEVTNYPIPLHNPVTLLLFGLLLSPHLLPLPHLLSLSCHNVCHPLPNVGSVVCHSL
jgi:hypothetical protein